MAEDSGQDRTEKATPRRREKAEEKGQLPKSQDLGSAFGLLIGVIGLRVFGGRLFGSISDFIVYIYNNTESIILAPSTVPVYANMIVKFSVSSLSAVLVMLMAAGIVINLAQDRFRFRFFPKALEIKWDKISPIKGMKQLFSFNSIFELFKGMIKLALVGFIAYKIVRKNIDLNNFWILYNATLQQSLVFFGKTLFEVGIKASALLMILGIADFVYQYYRNEKKLKMSKQEVKEERKQYEGSPEIKGKIRAKQRAMSRQRMMAAVPNATVVVTNPTFIAIAILYEPKEKHSAPKVIAKGKRKIAQKIKAIAIENNVPVIEDKALARGMYDFVEIGMEIPFIFYQAVAEVLARIFHKNPNRRPVRQRA